MRSEGPAVAAMPPRWVLALLLVAATLVAGCGGDDAEGGRPPLSDPLAVALSYMPASSGAVSVFATDLERGPLAELDRLATRSAGWRRVKRGLESTLRRSGIDLRSQLVNPLALNGGLSGPPGDVAGAVEVSDPGRARAAVEERLSRGRAIRQEPYDGALVWSEKGAAGGAVSALDGAVLVVAGSRRALERAIDSSRGEQSLAFDARFVKGLERLGPDALLRTFGDAQRLVGSDPDQAAALRQIPWVRALNTFESTLRVRRERLDVDFLLRTDRTPVRERDLPLAPGARAPRVHDRGAAAAVALLEPEVLARFLERVLEVTDPDRSAALEGGLRQLRSLFDVDVHRDLLRKVTNLSLSASSGTELTFVARLQRDQVAEVARTLRRAEPALQFGVSNVLPGTELVGRGSGDARVWVIRRGQLPLARYAVRGDALVGAVGLARLPAPARGSRLPGTTGSLALSGDVGRLAALLGSVFGFPERALDAVRGLGDIELGVRTGTSGLLGRGRIAVDAE